MEFSQKAGILILEYWCSVNGTWCFFEYSRLFFLSTGIVPLAALVKLTSYVLQLLYHWLPPTEADCLTNVAPSILPFLGTKPSISHMIFWLLLSWSSSFICFWNCLLVDHLTHLAFQGFDKLKEVVNKWAESPSAAWGFHFCQIKSQARSTILATGLTIIWRRLSR